MIYKYAVSFNCSSRQFEIGGGGEGESTIDAVGNDLNRIEQWLLEQAAQFEPAENWFASRDHEFVGQYVDVGNRIVSVICHHWDENDLDEGTYNLCVVLEFNGDLPTVIE